MLHFMLKYHYWREVSKPKSTCQKPAKDMLGAKSFAM